MPIGPDTDRQGSGRGDRNLHWEETTGAGDYGQGGGSEFRHMGEDFEYIVRHEPEAEGHGAENPWVAAIFDDSGRYSPVFGRGKSLADAQSLAVAYHQNEWQPGSEKDLQNPDNPDYVGNDLGDLVDPQDGTYEEEGTHGLPLLAAAAPMLGRMAATSFGMKAGSNLADKVTGGGSGGGGGGGAGGSTSY